MIAAMAGAPGGAEIVRGDEGSAAGRGGWAGPPRGPWRVAGHDLRGARASRPDLRRRGGSRRPRRDRSLPLRPGPMRRISQRSCSTSC